MEREFRLNWPLLVEEAVRRRHGLNLTQKQLAALAKVSTPTISRFEQNDKDIQLSSALAILDVLGMTEKRTLVSRTKNSQPIPARALPSGVRKERRASAAYLA